MIKALLLYVSVCLWQPAFRQAVQDVRVTTYSTGKINTPGYEGISFWVKANKRAYIRYAHGIDAEDIDLTWLGPEKTDGSTGFAVGFPEPGSRRWTIIPNGYTLTITDRTGKYAKNYTWEDEGAHKSGSSAAACAFCAQDEKGAMKIMQTYFLK